jgi:hypothetical protein
MSRKRVVNTNIAITPIVAAAVAAITTSTTTTVIGTQKAL